MNVDKNQTGKSLKRYYWLTFVIGGMVVGFLGCLVYSYIAKADHGLLSDATGNLKTDKPIVQTALTTAEVVSPSAFLGVEIISVDVIIAQQLSLASASGVIVNSVVDNSPADKAGLQRSDVILSLNSITVEDTDGFREIMAQLNPGDNVKIAYIRDGDKDTAYATLADSSAALEVAGDSSDSDGWGVSLSILSSDLRSSLRIPADIDGIVILSVKPGGTADEAGLRDGDVITGINNTPIMDMGEFFDALADDEDGTVLLDVYTQGTLRYVALDSAGVADSVAQAPTSLLDKILSVFINDDKVVLVSEHENEEDDYEKPVCKRLEESGESYED
ncbi:PDZ domain-containing protein [Planctomycetota bacterium]